MCYIIDITLTHVPVSACSGLPPQCSTFSRNENVNRVVDLKVALWTGLAQDSNLGRKPGIFCS